MTALMVALGAAIGAPLRYLTDRAIRRWHDGPFPWGTLTVNVVASLLLGFLAGASTRIPGSLSALVGTGLCGALSTYSTFSYENHQLLRGGDRFHGVANIVLSVLVGLGSAALGWSIGAAVV